MEPPNFYSFGIKCVHSRLSGGSYIHIDKPKPDGSPCRPSFNENTDWVLYGEDENSGEFFGVLINSQHRNYNFLFCRRSSFAIGTLCCK